MPISDRLDEIRDRYVEWHQDRGDHTPAPNTETWADADHPDESMEHCIVRNDVPAMLAALRSVLDLHQKGNARIVVGVAGQDVEHCIGCSQISGEDLIAWPCPTVRAAQAALGEES